MTLYWWMHWFWVTAQIAGCTVVAASTPATETAIENVTVAPTELASKQGFPFAKTLDHYTNKTIVTLNRPVVPPKVIGINAVNLSNRTRNNTFNNVTQFHPENRSTEKAGSITKPYTYKKEIMFKNASKSVRLKQEESNKNLTREESLAVVPLNVDNSSTSNTSNSKIWNGTANNSNNQINGKYTQKLVVASVSPTSTEESSRSNRARGTLFSIGLPREQTHQDKQFSKFSNDESPVGMYSGNGTSPTDIAIITLSCLAIVVLISMAGSFGFIMYRRKYLNPPQTLNSDKCSNPDSSGYIDDSTIRDNSEEMYSLDNDSFLNSLEAMTIQNYWTDSVKHTKL